MSETQKNIYPIRKFDVCGREIYHETSNGFKSWTTYSDNGHTIHHKAPHGYEWTRKFDKRNNNTYYENSRGYIEWRTYNEDGNLIHVKNSNGVDIKFNVK